MSALRKKSEEQKKIAENKFLDLSESEREEAIAEADTLRKAVEENLPPKPVVIVREGCRGETRGRSFVWPPRRRCRRRHCHQYYCHYYQ